MRITIIDDLASIQDLSLRERAVRAASPRVTSYLAWKRNSEVALLSYEDWPEKGLGFVFEIFVLSRYRSAGIGSELISFAEERASRLGRERLQLKPYGLDSEINPEWLISWYRKKGFLPSSDNAGHLDKFL